MKRVLVIGCCGTGKSTFSRRLHSLTLLPLFHLDQHYWNPGWVETQGEEWESIVNELISRDEWIIDGNYGGTMKSRIRRADTVVWIDLPRYLCIYRVLKRTILYKNKERRPDIADGCDERFEIDFLRYVWNFKRDKNPLLEKRLADAPGEITNYRLKTTGQIRKFFSGLQAGQ